MRRASKLLRGVEAREARGVLERLSRRYLALRLSSVDDPSLARGLAGLALVHAAFESAFPDRGHSARAERAVARALDLVATTPRLGPGLFSGVAGVAWVTEALFGDLTVAPDDDPIAAVDDLLESHLRRPPWQDPYDLVDGLAGIGVYALERLGRPSATRMLALVTDRLAETAARRRPGMAWWSDPTWISAPFRRTPHPEWNLGAAHGVPGVIAVLGRVAGAPRGVDARTKKRARALLDQAVAWVLAQELPRKAGDERERGAFADAVGKGFPRIPARLAWCYGDAGIAAALLVAARAVGQRAWARAATRIALAAAERTVASSEVVDAGLCHGAAGIAHIFHRMHRATGEERLATAACTWFARTLAMREARSAFGGFGKNHDFLTGAGGITLALLAAVTNTEPIWDRTLVVS